MRFEVDSIELATPELFSQENQDIDLNQDNQEEVETKLFDESNSIKEDEVKEPEMFEETNLEEEFEIPAFLRKQKN